MLHRMQVLMDDDNRNGLMLWSMEENRSMSDLMRESVAEKLKKRKVVKVKKMSALEALKKAVKEAQKLGPSNGPADFAERHNEYLY